jgi:Zn-dependent protease/predicted transcriptional regulator
MFGKQIRLFTLLGFEIRIDLSWIVIAVLIVWTLAKGVFTESFPRLPDRTYWIMGIAAALGLFASIVFHELCHSLVSRRFDMPMKGITLFIFGGVAEMGDEPPTPKAEFLMAIAGPLSSVFLGLLLYGVSAVGQMENWPVPVNGTVAYLAYINLILAAFNMIPAFPLDGGRVLRSALWKWKGDLKRSTRIASAIGSGFGIALILLGVFSVFMGNLVGGIWWFLIGVFLRNASMMSYQQVLLRKTLEGERVRRFMSTDPVSVKTSFSLRELVENYIYKFHFKMFPVVENERLLGCVSTRQVQEVPQAEWDRHEVGELAQQCSPENTVSPDADAMKALSLMNQTQNSRLLVVEGDRLVGIITLKDLLQFFSEKMDLDMKKEIERG